MGQLKPHVYIHYGSNVVRDHANQVLGFVTAAPKKWAGQTDGTRMMIPELDEVTVEFEMVL